MHRKGTGLSDLRWISVARRSLREHWPTNDYDPRRILRPCVRRADLSSPETALIWYPETPTMVFIVTEVAVPLQTSPIELAKPQGNHGRPELERPKVSRTRWSNIGGNSSPPDLLPVRWSNFREENQSSVRLEMFFPSVTKLVPVAPSRNLTNRLCLPLR